MVREIMISKVNTFPFIHRIPFFWARSGFRGSHFLWKFALSIHPIRSGWVRLPDEFILNVQHLDWNKVSIYKGQYERALRQFLESMKLEGLVIDVGANVGSILWSASQNNELPIRIIAFEPSPKLCQELEFLKSTYDLDILVENFAVGADEISRKIYGLSNELHSGSASFVNQTNSLSDVDLVKVKSLDKYFEDNKLTDLKISLLKIDTEGFEGEVIRGILKTLVRRPPSILVLEVSPEFSEITYLNELWDTLHASHEFFELTEKKVIRSVFKLKKVYKQTLLDNVLQWNLIVIEKNIL